MSDVPQELIDAIIENVHDSSLVACSLTARSFVTSSQRRLFRWMSLHRLAAYERMAVILAGSPQLAQYVLSLALDINELPPNSSILSSILARLTNLERVSITGYAPHWPRNQIGLHPCLVQLLDIPSLKGLALHNLSDVPFSLIMRALTTLEEVQLSLLDQRGEDLTDAISMLSIAARSPQDTAGESLPAPTALWHLEVFGDDLAYLLNHPKRTAALNHLKRLSVVFPPVPQAVIPEFTTLLVACSNTLNHLELELQTAPTLPTLPAVKVLVLWLDVELAKTPSDLASIVSGAVASTPHLEDLTIAFLDRPPNPRRPVRHQWKGHRPWNWADLDAVLVDDIPHLRKAHFSLRSFDKVDERYEAFGPYISGNLPRTFNTGSMRFSYRPASMHPMDRFAERWE
ncbi:hypothetical protein C8R43DRAFT_1103551 [Mycena crocata]|nr:hypothetical protein C8R43DRAFT_1103551 [Mycena crocata]